MDLFQRPKQVTYTICPSTKFYEWSFLVIDLYWRTSLVFKERVSNPQLLPTILEVRIHFEPIRLSSIKHVNIIMAS